MSFWFILSLLACNETALLEHRSSVDTEQGNYTLDLTWEPNPHAVGEQVSLEITPFSDNPTLKWTDVTITPFMPEHNHGLTEPIEVVEQSNSTTGYWIYPMGGNWEITIDIDSPHGPDTATMEIEVW